MATYYIDYNAANDSANGTSKDTPWKRCPGMAGYSRSPSHQPGDRFIFKGGVTWPRASLPLIITNGGSSDSVRDYYGVDQTWYTGGSFTQPKFDFEHNLIGSWATGGGVVVNGVSYITFDNLNLANHRQPLDSGGPTARGCSVLQLINAVNYVTVQNCSIRDWDVDVASISATVIDGGSSRGIDYWPNGASGGNGNKALNNLFTQEGVSCRSGRAIGDGWGEVSGNEIRYTLTGLLGGGNIHHNYIHNLESPSDPKAHGNALYLMWPSSVHDNVIHSLVGSCMPIYPTPGFIGSSGNYLIYNNVVYNGSTGGSNNGCICIDPAGASATVGVQVFNNTLQNGSQAIRVVGPVTRPGQRTGLVELRNNLYIDAGVNYEANAAISFINTNNIQKTSSEMTGFGATSSNNYQPTSGSSPTIDAGTSLVSYFTTDRLGVSRPQGGAWDIGAYEYGGTPAPPTLNISSISPTSGYIGTAVTITGTAFGATKGSSTVTFNGTTATPVSWGDTSIVTPVPSGATTGNVVVTVTSVASNGVNFTVTAPIALPTWNANVRTPVAPFYVADDNSITQDSQTTDPSLGGQVDYDVNITSAGYYEMSGSVKGEDGASNSMFVFIDQQPASSDGFTWGTLTVGFETRWVRVAPNFAEPDDTTARRNWYLTVGIHHVIVRGREAGTKLASLTLSPVGPPDAPSSLSATAISFSQINLSWADVVNETGFKIERKTGVGGTYAQIGTVGAAVTTYNSTGLVTNTTYYYRVRATNAFGDSTYSNEANATTSTTAAPSGLAATTISISQINLAWADVAGETGFKIERKTGSGGTYAQIGTTSIGVLTYNSTGLTSNTAYYYRVRATTSGDDTSYSNEVNATTLNDLPTPPVGLQFNQAAKNVIMARR